jgi:hypothetical protein
MYVCMCVCVYIYIYIYIYTYRAKSTGAQAPGGHLMRRPFEVVVNHAGIWLGSQANNAQTPPLVFGVRLIGRGGRGGASALAGLAILICLCYASVYICEEEDTCI